MFVIYFETIFRYCYYRSRGSSWKNYAILEWYDHVSEALAITLIELLTNGLEIPIGVKKDYE